MERAHSGRVAQRIAVSGTHTNRPIHAKIISVGRTFASSFKRDAGHDDRGSVVVVVVVRRCCALCDGRLGSSRRGDRVGMQA